MSDEGVRIESGESYTSAGIITGIRHWLIKLIAGDMPVLLNLEISVRNSVDQVPDDVIKNATGFLMKNIILSTTQYTYFCFEQKKRV